MRCSNMIKVSVSVTCVQNSCYYHIKPNNLGKKKSIIFKKEILKFICLDSNTKYFEKHIK